MGTYKYFITAHEPQYPYLAFHLVYFLTHCYRNSDSLGKLLLILEVHFIMKAFNT